MTLAEENRLVTERTIRRAALERRQAVKPGVHLIRSGSRVIGAMTEEAYQQARRDGIPARLERAVRTLERINQGMAAENERRWRIARDAVAEDIARRKGGRR